MIDTIRRRREGGVHTAQELKALAMGAADGSIQDYQLAAWLMAACLNPLTPQETADLTIAMAESGERLDLSSLPRPWVDKHSTGGVGDKTTLVLLPILAACGLTLVKMSGRGLGITGGTIDKLESVPGFRTDLTPEEMVKQAKMIGLALTGQTPRLAPADKALYALRDATGTVDSIPLIVSSILSKKMAGGAETILLDVKCGSGAFMKDLGQARQLRDALNETGRIAGLNVRAHITDMEQPLGRAVGNALEVKEAIRVLKGEEKGRFAELCFRYAAETLEAVGQADGAAQVAEVIRNGGALQAAMHWFHAQGGDLEVFEEDETWQLAPTVTQVVHTGEAGWVSAIDARAVGQFVVDLGGGRKSKTDAVDPRVGVVLHTQVGDRIEPGQPLYDIHSDGPVADPGLLSVGAEQTAARDLFLD